MWDSRVRRRLALARLELLDDATEVVDGIDASFVAQIDARRPSRIERVERPLHVEHLRVAVAVGGDLGPDLPAAPGEGGVAVLDQFGVAVDVGPGLQGQTAAGAEKVVLLDAEAAAVLAALSTELDFGLQGPGVLGDDLDVHRTVVVRHRADVGIAQIVVAAQDPLGLPQQPRVVPLPGTKQQLRGDGRFAGDDVDLVRYSKQSRVLLIVVGVKNVDPDKAHLADDGAASFQHRIFGNAGRAHELPFFQARTRAGQQVGRRRNEE